MGFADTYSIVKGWKERARQRAEDEALGNSLYSLFRDEIDQRNKAGMAPYQKRVGEAGAAVQGQMTQPDYDVIMRGMSGDPTAMPRLAEEMAKMGKTHQTAATQLAPAQRDMSLASLVYGANPLGALKGMRGSQVLRALPTVLEMDQNRIAGFERQRAESRRMGPWSGGV